MGAWNSLADYVADLRRFLNDGPYDKPVKGKKVLGDADGVKSEFVTFDDRLVPDTLVVTILGNEVPAEQVTVTDLLQGRFTTAPPAGAEVQGRYYYQDFLDVELQEASQLAADSIVPGTDDVTLVPAAFKLAALMFGAYFAYMKLAAMYARRRSDKFLLMESPVDEGGGAQSNMFRDLASSMLRGAKEARNDAIEGSGRRAIAAFGVVYHRIPKIGPAR